MSSEAPVPDADETKSPKPAETETTQQPKAEEKQSEQAASSDAKGSTSGDATPATGKHKPWMIYQRQENTTRDRDFQLPYFPVKWQC